MGPDNGWAVPGTSSCNVCSELGEEDGGMGVGEAGAGRCDSDDACPSVTVVGEQEVFSRPDDRAGTRGIFSVCGEGGDEESISDSPT